MTVFSGCHLSSPISPAHSLCKKTLTMEVLGSDKGSDFITNFAFVPPSPPPLDSVFDYPSYDLAPITSPPIPQSSYNGSYYSPYSQHSELSFSGDDIQLQDFPGSMNDYEPSDYDAPNQPSSLLMFTNDSDYTSPHHKNQSPPRLLMPEDQQQQQQHNVPIINAPYGDDDIMDGPQLCIVPATPVGAPGSGRNNVLFQPSLGQGICLLFLLRSVLIGSPIQVLTKHHQTTTSNHQNNINLSMILLHLDFLQPKKTVPLDHLPTCPLLAASSSLMIIHNSNNSNSSSSSSSPVLELTQIPGLLTFSPRRRGWKK